MCDVGNIILNSVLTFASVWIVRKFLDTFYEKKRWNVLSVSVWLIYILFFKDMSSFTVVMRQL